MDKSNVPYTKFPSDEDDQEASEQNVQPHEQPSASPAQPQYYAGQPPPGQPAYMGQPPPPQPIYGGQQQPSQYVNFPSQIGVPPIGVQPGMTGQPGGAPAAQWMPMPQGIAGCPPGLEYLSQIDQILVHQQVELLELLTNFETCNRYQIKNSLGQLVYFAQEESDTCHRQCCGPSRGFVMHITDNSQQEVMRVNREFKCCAGCCWCAGSDCCAMEVSVEAPVGTTVGYVKQCFSPWSPRYVILDANKLEFLNVEGPCCPCQAICCTSDREFEVMNLDKTTQIGKVTKQWGGYFKEVYTKADNFGVTFPLDLDVKMKAVMVGAVFLIGPIEIIPSHFTSAWPQKQYYPASAYHLATSNLQIRYRYSKLHDLSDNWLNDFRKPPEMESSTCRASSTHTSSGIPPYVPGNSAGSRNPVRLELDDKNKIRVRELPHVWWAVWHHDK